MAFDLKRFYQQLDASYDLHDLAETEKFLLSSRERSEQDPTVTSGSEGCMSCAPELTLNLNYVCVSNELGCFYRGLSRWQDAIDAFDAAQREMEQYYAADNPEYGVVLLNKAGVYRYMGDHQQALQTFEKARKLLEANDATPPETLAGLYNNIGLVLLDLNQPEEAVRLFSEAMILLGDLNGHPVEYGTTCNNLAAVYDRMGRLEEAIAASGQAIDTLSTIDNGLNCHYPAALNTRGTIYFHKGELRQALADFSSAAEKTRTLYGENVEYASACSNCAICCAQMNDAEQAQLWQKRSLDTIARLKA